MAEGNADEFDLRREIMEASTKPMFSAFLMLSGALLLLIVYYYAYPFWSRVGLSCGFVENLMLELYRSGLMRLQFAVRVVCLFFCLLSFVVRSGQSRDSEWVDILVPLCTGAVLFLLSGWFGNGVLFVLSTVVGYVFFAVGAVLLGRKW